MSNVEHIGIAVRDIEHSCVIYEALLSMPLYKTEEISSEGVLTAFFQSGSCKIELLQAINEQSAIHKFIEKNGEGLHHIAIKVEDIFSEIQRLSDSGFQFISTEPRKGADNKLVCFIHPKSTNGVLFELCQDCE